MADNLNLNFDKLQSIAIRGNNNSVRSSFWSEFLRQWTALGNDGNSPDAFKRARGISDEIFNGYQTSGRGYGGGVGTGGGNYVTVGGNTIGSGVGSFMNDALRASQRGGGRSEPEFGSIEKSLGLILDSGGLKNAAGVWKQIKTILKDEVIIYLQQQTKLYEVINEKAGMTGELAADFRNELMEASPELIRLGISFDEMSDSVATLLKNSGKFKLLSSDTIKEMGLASKFTSDMGTFAEMGYHFEKIGLGIKDMSTTVEEMGLRSLRLGLNARRTTEDLDKYLNKLNQYGFKNGIEGLNRMVQQSIEFRMNMNNVFDLAEKVWSPEGALEVVANLQMIGGAYGDLNDPIKMMYMATNDVEGLQDAIIGAAKSLVTYNDEQGRFVVTGANLRRAKEMATELGMSMEDLTTTAVAAMERTRAASDLSGIISGIPKDDKEFLINLAQMKGGRMVIEVPKTLQEQLGGTEVALEDMSEKQAEAILSRKEEFDKIDSMEQIARQQVTLVENMQRDLSYLRAMARVSVGTQIGELMERTLGVNQRTLSEESKKITDWLANKIQHSDEIMSTVLKEIPEFKGLVSAQKGKIEAENKSGIYKIPEEKQKLTTAEPEAVTTTSNIRVVHVLNSGTATMDELARSVLRSPEFLSDFRVNLTEGYLDSPIPK
jgi:hypothetical protein